MHEGRALIKDDTPRDDTEHSEFPDVRYAWYVVAVLTLAYIVSFIDRQILGLLVGPIQRDLGIGDKISRSAC